MSKRSATDKIKGLNSDNKSGAIKQALDLVKNLENSKAGEQNPEAMSAMGGGQVAGMLKGLMQLMQGGGGSQGQTQEEKEDEKQKQLEEIEELRRRIEEIEQELAEHLAEEH
jgi:hypothetical protein